jgi:hypothetical protein
LGGLRHETAMPLAFTHRLAQRTDIPGLKILMDAQIR